MTGILPLLLFVSLTMASEPSCPACSKYEYEEKVLERMIRMEFAFEKVLHENKEVSRKMQIDYEKFIEETKLDLNRIHEEKERLNAIVNDMKEQQDQAEQRLVLLMEEVEKNQSRTLYKVVNDSNNMLEQISDITDQISTPLVNFHAHSPQTSSLSTDEVIVYKSVDTNQGNGYSTTTGKFTAPVRGLYLFFMHTCTNTNYYAFLQLVKEGSVLIASIQYDTDNYSCSSGQVFVQLDSGENVWVKCSSGSSNRRLFERSYGWTSFGGALIHN